MKAISSLSFLFILVSALCFSIPAFGDEELDCEITVEPTLCQGTTRVTTPEELADYLSGPKTSNLVIGHMDGGLVVVGEDVDIATGCKVTIPVNTTLITASLAIEASEVVIMGKVIGVEDEVIVGINTPKFSLGTAGRLKNVCELSIQTIDADIMGVVRGTLFDAGDCPNEQTRVELCAEHKASFGTDARMTAFQEAELIAGHSMMINGSTLQIQELFFGPENLPKLEIMNAYLDVEDVEAEATNINISNAIIDGKELIFFETEGGKLAISTSQLDAPIMELGAEEGQFDLRASEINAIETEMATSEGSGLQVSQSSLMCQEELVIETEGGPVDMKNTEMFAEDFLEIATSHDDDAIQLSGIDVIATDTAISSAGDAGVKNSRLLLFGDDFEMEIAGDLNFNGLLFKTFGNAEYSVGGDYTATGVNSFDTAGTCTFNVNGTSTGQEPCP